MEISSIDASLEEGRLLSERYIAILIIEIIITFLLPMSGLILLTILLFAESLGYAYTIFTVILLVVCGLSGTGGYTYFIILNRKKRKRIMLYLVDAKPVIALSKTIETCRGVGLPLKEVKIQVTFTFDGVRYTRISGRADSRKKFNGFAKIFAKYADRSINILYSQAYDQVLLVKEK